MINMLNKRSNRTFDIKTVGYEEMIAIPNNDDDLVPVPVYINLDKKIRVDKSIKESDIEHKALKLIFLGQSEAAIDVIFNLYRDKKWEKGFQFDLLMCFWLSIHVGNKELLNKIMIFDVYLRQLVVLAAKSKREKPKGWRKPEKEKNDISAAINLGTGVAAFKEFVGEGLRSGLQSQRKERAQAY